MGGTTGATPDGDVVSCAECGHETAGRFCGRCGARLVVPDPAPPTPRAPRRAIEHDAASRAEDATAVRRPRLGRLLAIGAIVGLLVVAGAVWSPPPEEVVTVPGDGSAGARTSTIAVGPLERTYWEVAVDGTTDAPIAPLWGEFDDVGNVVLLGPGRSTTIDRDTGALETRVRGPWGFTGGPLLEAGHVFTVGPDGAVDLLGEVVGPVPSPFPHRLQPFGDGWLGVADRSIVALGADLQVQWTATTGSWTTELLVTDSGHVLASGAQLTALDGETGAEVFTRTPGGLLHPAIGGAPLVHDGAVLVTDLPGAGAVDLASGDERWRVDATGASWVWAGDGRGIAVRTGDGGYVAMVVDLTDGRVLREVRDVVADLGGPGFDGGEAPLRTADGVVLPLGADGDELRYGLLRPDGELSWTVSLPRARVVEGRSRLRRDPRTGAAVELRVEPTGEVSVVRLSDGETLLAATVGRDDLLDSLFAAQPLAVGQGVVATSDALASSVTLRDLASGTALEGRGRRAHGTPWGMVMHGATRVRALDHHGEERWERSGVGHVIGIAPTGVLTVTDDGERVELLSPEDGEPRATTEPLPGYPHAAVVGPDTLLLTTFPGGPEDGESWPQVLAVDPDDLTERWRTQATGYRVQASESWVVDLGTAVVRVLDPASGAVVRTLPLTHLPASAATVADALVTTDGRRVGAVDLRSGEPLWEVETTSAVTAGPIVAGDEVLVGTADGAVLRIDPADGSHRRDGLTDEPIVELAGLHEVLLVRTPTTLRLVGPEEMPRRLRDAAAGVAPPGDEVRLPDP